MVHAPAAPLAPLQEALAAFRQQYPTFDTTRVLDELRATEYARLDPQQHVYLDYTGGGLYAECQLRDYFHLINDKVFGNPHSTNPASQAMNTLVEQARRYVLDYFRASPEEYIAIFTANATAAVKLVAEAYPFALVDSICSPSIITMPSTAFVSLHGRKGPPLAMFRWSRPICV
jgi:molybdenum cofactor sulfurtransferase